jgi:hypothetical protein
VSDGLFAALVEAEDDPMAKIDYQVPSWSLAENAAQGVSVLATRKPKLFM